MKQPFSLARGANVWYYAGDTGFCSHTLSNFTPPEGDDSGYDLRAVNRYINQGINSLATVENMARFFFMDIVAFLQLGLNATGGEADE